MRTRLAFTLMELMVVIAIIAIIAAAGVSSFYMARDRSRQSSCISNLRQFEQAKETWAMMNSKNNGDPVAFTDVFPLLMKGAGVTCPSGGSYTLQPVGTAPTCSIGGSFPHQLGYTTTP